MQYFGVRQAVQGTAAVRSACASPAAAAGGERLERQAGVVRCGFIDDQRRFGAATAAGCSPIAAAAIAAGRELRQREVVVVGAAADDLRTARRGCQHDVGADAAARTVEAIATHAAGRGDGDRHPDPKRVEDVINAPGVQREDPAAVPGCLPGPGGVAARAPIRGDGAVRSTGRGSFHARDDVGRGGREAAVTPVPGTTAVVEAAAAPEGTHRHHDRTGADNRGVRGGVAARRGCSVAETEIVVRANEAATARGGHHVGGDGRALVSRRIGGVVIDQTGVRIAPPARDRAQARAADTTSCGLTELQRPVHGRAGCGIDQVAARAGGRGAAIFGAAAVATDLHSTVATAAVLPIAVALVPVTLPATPAIWPGPIARPPEPPRAEAEALAEPPSFSSNACAVAAPPAPPSLPFQAAVPPGPAAPPLLP